MRSCQGVVRLGRGSDDGYKVEVSNVRHQNIKNRESVRGLCHQLYEAWIDVKKELCGHFCHYHK